MKLSLGSGFMRPQRALLDTSPQTMLFFGDSVTANGQLASPTGYITGLTKASPGSVTSSAHAFVDNDQLFTWGVQGMTQVNEQLATILKTDANHFTNGTDTTGFGTYSSGGKSFRTNAVHSNYAKGYMSPMNMVLGQRFGTPVRNNRGIIGNTSTDLVNRMAVDVPNALGATIGIVMIGTNDVAAGLSTGTIQSNILAVIGYLINTLGLRVVLGTVPPRTADNTTQRDQKDTLNAWIRTQASSNVIVWDYFDDVADSGTRDWKAGYSSDGTHPTDLGGYAMGSALARALRPYYGYQGYSLNAGNLLSNPSFNGTGGTAGGGITNNGIAANWTASVTFGTANYRTVSKGAGGEQIFDIAAPSGAGSIERTTFSSTISSGFTAGTWYVAEMEMVVDSFLGTGLMLENRLELRSNSAAISLDNADNTTGLLVSRMITDGGQNRLLLRSLPARCESGYTSMVLRFISGFKCNTGDVTCRLRFFNAQVYPVAAPY